MLVNKINEQLVNGIQLPLGIGTANHLLDQTIQMKSDYLIMTSVGTQYGKYTLKEKYGNEQEVRDRYPISYQIG